VTAPVERLVRLNDTERLRIAVVPVPRRRGPPFVVRLSVRVRRGDGSEGETLGFTLEPCDVRPVAQALAALARELEAGGSASR
jgi:hypothetical protein